MKFVVDALAKYLYLDRSNATQAMLAVHKNGYAVMAVHSHDEAARISRLISVEAERGGYPLICCVTQAQPTSSPGEGS